MSLMSASYPGYYNAPPSVPWRGGVTSTNGRAVSRPSTAVSRETGILSSRSSGASPFAEQPLSPTFVPSVPSADAQALRHVNTAVTLGNNKLDDDDLHEKHYGKSEENYTSSSAMAIPGVQDSNWKKGSGSHNNNNNSGPGSPVGGSPGKRSSLDIEKEINGQNLYKTELCRSFVETGTCRYGSKCQFAHGQNELRPVLRHPKYKTDFCKTFHTIGTCPYGTRCRFIHKRSEVEVGGNSVILPVSALPEWSIWRDGNTPEGKQYQGLEHEKKPRSISLKERRKTTDIQQLQKVEKNKVQRVIGRQRSNTDSPPPPLRNKKNQNGLKKPVPLSTAAPVKHDNLPTEKGHHRRKSTGNSWSDDVPSPETPMSSVVQSIVSPPAQAHHLVPGHLNGGGLVAPPHVASVRHMREPLAMPRGSGGSLGFLAQTTTEEAYLPPEVLAEHQLLPAESASVETHPQDKSRRRSNSSASRLPIFQELCTASEEEIAIGATASTVVNRVLSSSS